MKLIGRLARGLDLTGSMFLLCLMLVVTVDVTMRAVFDRPILAGWEISQFILAAVIWCSVAYTFRVKGHVTIDALVSRFPFRVKTLLEIAARLLTLAFFVLVTWQSMLSALTSFQQKEITDTAHIPVGPIKLLIPLGALIVSLEMIVQLAQSIHELRQRDPEHVAER